MLLIDDDAWDFHLFGANFESEEHAQLYIFEQWEAEPPATASDDEYSAWEERNPTWRLAEDLEFHMDSDFVEYPGGIEGVLSQMRCPAERAQVIAKGSAFTHFIMIGSNPSAIWCDRRSLSDQVEPVTRLPESTATITYLGKYST